ncbi:MAG TPA: 2OG-Fe(II) oxygenase [Gammaproteobacteria bacterium]|jgi:Rps23 Pro-64 3,4-dihydroxylase Tpa1-like proline 4-hydroxylase|nr:2OG-Fe(II) oxygenase [Gammaproteobacteria bacterium]
MKETFVDLIIQRLTRDQANLSAQFHQKHAVAVARHVVVDDLLPADLAHQLVSVFPPAKKMRLLHSYGEIKMKYCAVKNTDALLQALHQAIQDPRVVACIERITGILHQLPDMSKQAGGVSTLLKGHYLNPHLDNSHNLNKSQYRVMNLLYYISPDWKLENGGNYELWNERVTERIVIPCLFNRLVIMETNGRSWHAVNPVLVDKPRRCVFNYYFSEHSPTGEPYFFGASSIFFNPLFKARPEQKIRRALARVFKR